MSKKNIFQICFLLCIHVGYAQQIFFKNIAYTSMKATTMDSIVNQLDATKTNFFPWITKKTIKNDSIIYSWQSKAQDKKLNVLQLERITSALYNNVFKDVNGKLLNGSTFKNKIVVINYWADFCIPCIKEIGVLSAIKNYFIKDTNVVFLAPCYEKIGQCKTTTNKFSFNYFTVNKKGTDILSTAAGTYRFPTTIIINKKGVVTHYYYEVSARQANVKPEEEPLYYTLTNTIDILLKQ